MLYHWFGYSTFSVGLLFLKQAVCVCVCGSNVGNFKKSTGAGHAPPHPQCNNYHKIKLLLAWTTFSQKLKGKRICSYCGEMCSMFVQSLKLCEISAFIQTPIGLLVSHFQQVCGRTLTALRDHDPRDHVPYGKCMLYSSVCKQTHFGADPCCRSVLKCMCSLLVFALIQPTCLTGH